MVTAEKTLKEVDKLLKSLSKNGAASGGEREKVELPENGIVAEWFRVLYRIEWALLKVSKELADALEGEGGKNLFDLMATLNQLLDILDRLHTHAHAIKRYAIHHAGGPAPENTPPRFYLPPFALKPYTPKIKDAKLGITIG